MTSPEEVLKANPADNASDGFFGVFYPWIFIDFFLVSLSVIGFSRNFCVLCIFILFVVLLQFLRIRRNHTKEKKETAITVAAVEELKGVTAAEEDEELKKYEAIKAQVEELNARHHGDKEYFEASD